MTYIKKIWKDYPDRSTPITAEALQNIEDGIEALEGEIGALEGRTGALEGRTGALEEGIETLDTDKADKEVVLYNNATGTTGTVTLSETSANFSYLEIFYGNANKTGCGSAKVYSPNGKGVDMNVHNFAGGRYYVSQTRANISGTTIIPAGYSANEFSSSNTEIANVNAIYIYRVVGYR